MLTKLTDRLSKICPFEFKDLFNEFIDPVSTIRNAMDHINARIDNLSERKGPVIPISGAISFTIPEFHLRENQSQSIVAGVNIITLFFGPLTHPSHQTPIPNPSVDGIMMPFGPIIFHAFDNSINLNRLINALDYFCDFMDSTYKDYIFNIIDDHSLKTGISVAKLKAPQVSMPKIEAKIKFDE